MNRHMMLLLVVMAITMACYNACDYRYYRERCVTAVAAVMTCFVGFRL